MIMIHCPDCQTEIQRPDGDAGKTIFCPKCFFMLVVQQPTQTAIHTPDHRFQTTEPMSAKAPADEFVVVCPQCCGSTDSLKAIEIRNILCLYVFIAWNNESVIGCPKCARSILLSRMLIAIPASNFLFPIYGLIYLLQYIEAGSKGHSDPAVARAHRMTLSQYLDQAQLTKPSRGIGYWLVATILILFICGLAYLITGGLRRG